MDADLKKVPQISPGAMGRVFRVGPEAITAAAQRVGVALTRTPTGRQLLSYEQARAVRRELPKGER